MIRILLVGALGRMGQQVVQATMEQPDMQVVAGVNLVPGAADFPVFTNIRDVDVAADVVIDFSRAESLDDILDYSMAHRLPTLICSTGHNDRQRARLVEASEQIPVFFSYNNSVGIAVMRSLVQKAAQALGDAYDIEIVEKHHNKKVDAPSGTAVMLFNSINETRDGALVPVYDRQSVVAEREGKEVGIMSLRGGNIAGEHSVFFCGTDETIEIRHTATSRGVFANGALRAARFLVKKSAGLYDMNDVLGL